ncbi:MAG: hypothetical protein EBU49_15335, partial [Proteobacteria bacterium]|nr:hypothetical protein [Pseudomonadota bacterium]
LGWTGSAWDNYLNSVERVGTAAIITAAVASESSTYQYVLIVSTSPCSGATYASSSLPGANTADLTADGSYKACVEITDTAGNKAYAASSSNLVLDTVAPTATMTFANAAATDGFISASEHASSSSAMGSAPSGSADLSAVTYKLIPTATTCAGALSFAGGIPAADSADFASDGTYVICMR